MRPKIALMLMVAVGLSGCVTPQELYKRKLAQAPADQQAAVKQHLRLAGAEFGNRFRQADALFAALPPEAAR